MRTTPPTAAALATLTGLLVAALPLTGAAAGQAEVPTCDGKVATIVADPATPHGEWVHGTPGDDVIVGSDGFDNIDGGEGDDTICGLDSADTIVGGPGDDRLFGGGDTYVADDDYWGDVVQPGPGDDFVDLGPHLGPDDIYFADGVYGDKVSYADAPGPVRVDLGAGVATGHGTDTFAASVPDTFAGIVGSPYDDVLVGGAADDTIHGGGGSDVIDGGPGNDELDGDAVTNLHHRRSRVHAPDAVSGGEGADLLYGGDGDELRGGARNDDFFLSDGGEARGGAGDDDVHVTLRRSELTTGRRAFVGGPGWDGLELRVAFGRPGGPLDLRLDVPRRAVRVAGRRWASLRGTEELAVSGTVRRGRVAFRGGPRKEVFREELRGAAVVRVAGGGGRDRCGLDWKKPRPC
ncbi:calcium-binding protein [Nocardioides solisilvae]|uniref:calcium-binding protein n=1 Tax=Nocardioides solisilvae TaxID=1542435 RepID=UPI000D750CDA|nr:calcium-binding protein [Nocardioides solisilvae]